ncbi:hypothetical protein ACH5RR_032161 [Cinchona calisaya]|uniref:Uncharacterized protein n=1 Tax=Cinchona calisaya TaxID=153742 RepID=A0ABD2YJZ2_9GENT
MDTCGIESCGGKKSNGKDAWNIETEVRLKELEKCAREIKESQKEMRLKVEVEMLDIMDLMRMSLSAKAKRKLE